MIVKLPQKHGYLMTSDSKHQGFTESHKKKLRSDAAGCKRISCVQPFSNANIIANVTLPLILDQSFHLVNS